MDKQSLHQGVNLGGWLSQYPRYDHEHFRHFIVAADIERIAGWGMDHIRLPFDYPVLEDDARPGTYQESGFDYIEACLEWCSANRLKLVLDLHQAPGYSFDNLQGSPMFTDPLLQERFLALWEAVTLRFQHRYPDTLAYELLNEVVLPDSAPWNALAALALRRIRALDATRLIVVGGNYYNMPEQLRFLELPHDDHLLYTFHYYKPFLVTHQLAPWIPFMVRYGKRVEYPGEAVDLGPALAHRPDDDPLIRTIVETEFGRRLDKGFLRDELHAAVDFMRQTGEPLYCGEFGVHELASLATRLNWTRDFVDLLEEYRMGRAYWSYKATDFGLVDQGGRIVSQELVDLLSQSPRARSVSRRPVTAA